MTTSYEGGYFPVHVESNNDPDVAHWLEDVIHMVPVAQRPDRLQSPRAKEPRSGVDPEAGRDRQAVL